MCAYACNYLSFKIYLVCIRVYHLMYLEICFYVYVAGMYFGFMYICVLVEFRLFGFVYTGESYDKGKQQTTPRNGKEG